MIRMLHRILKCNHFNVTIAESGEQALLRVAEATRLNLGSDTWRPFDVVLLDVMMPNVFILSSLILDWKL